MSISDPRVETGSRTADRTAVKPIADAPNLATPLPLSVPDDSGGTHAASPQHTISDRDLTLMQSLATLSCVALPLSLLLLSRLSSASVNASAELLANIKLDSLFPGAVVLALALGGTYRVAHRRLQPTHPQLRQLSFGVGCGCVLALAIGEFLHGAFGTAEPYATQLVMAVIVAIGVITAGTRRPALLVAYADHARVLVVGSGTTANRVMLSVRQEPAMTLVGRAVDGDTVNAGAIGRVTDLPELCRQLGVDRLLVAASEHSSAESLDIYRRLENSVPAHRNSATLPS